MTRHDWGHGWPSGYGHPTTSLTLLTWICVLIHITNVTYPWPRASPVRFFFYSCLGFPPPNTPDSQDIHCRWNIAESGKLHKANLHGTHHELLLIPKAGYGIWCLMPLSTIFQLYCGGKFYWWRKHKYLEKTTDLSHVISSTPHHERDSNSQRIVVIGTDCTGSCKCNYHMIMTMMLLSPPIKKTVKETDSQVLILEMYANMSGKLKFYLDHIQHCNVNMCLVLVHLAWNLIFSGVLGLLLLLNSTFNNITVLFVTETCIQVRAISDSF